MKLFRLPKISYPSDRRLEQQLELMRQSIEDMSRRLEAIPYLDGRLIEGVAFAALSTTPVYHGLGRVPRGWIVVRIPSATLGVSCYETARNAETLSLYSITDLTVDLWVF